MKKCWNVLHSHTVIHLTDRPTGFPIGNAVSNSNYLERIFVVHTLIGRTFKKAERYRKKKKRKNNQRNSCPMQIVKRKSMRAPNSSIKKVRNECINAIIQSIHAYCMCVNVQKKIVCAKNKWKKMWIEEYSIQRSVLLCKERDERFILILPKSHHNDRDSDRL